MEEEKLSVQKTGDRPNLYKITLVYTDDYYRDLGIKMIAPLNKDNEVVFYGTTSEIILIKK